MNINENLSEHFTLHELCYSTTASIYGIDNTTIDNDVVDNLRYLAQHILEPLRKTLGESVIITSGYRCKDLNKKVGGAWNSQHINGEAVDIHIKTPEYANKVCNILSKNSYVDQLLYEHSKSGTSWIHVSTSRTRYPRHLIRLSYIV